MTDTLTGELTERRLEHGYGEAQAFCRSLRESVRVGIEAGLRSKEAEKERLTFGAD
jgi:hypothetical protein